MNKKVIIAGAGHGGLVCAYNLAKNGFSVTVYEKSQREELGYDWLDTMEKYVFKDCNLPQPPEDVFGEYETAVFNSPYKSIAVGKGGRVRKSLGYADRKWLINYLIDSCLSVGVVFCFGNQIKAPLTDNNRIIGIVLESGEKIFSPLTVDACGIDSPLRKNIPCSLGIQNEITNEDTFHVYRAYYDYLPSDLQTAKYNIYFFNCNRKGLDWVIREKDAVDILVGGFGKLSEEDVDVGVNCFRSMFDFIGNNILRGGQIKTIPVRKTLSKIITDGYVMVGDSASMVEPLSGSGITLSFYGGKILADTVISLNSDSYNCNELWSYQYKYFSDYGNKQIKADILKGFLTSVSCDDIEYLFTSRFLTDKELGSSGKNKTAKDKFDKIKSVLFRPSILPVLLKTAIKLLSINRICNAMPETYDSEKINVWRRKYDKL